MRDQFYKFDEYKNRVNYVLQYKKCRKVLPQLYYLTVYISRLLTSSAADATIEGGREERKKPVS